MQLPQQAENLPGRLAIMNLPQDQSPRSANHGDDESSAIERILELCRCHQELIGYEIHDGFVQRATAALLHLQAYLALDDEGHTGQRRDAIEMAADLLTQSVEEARSFIGGVRSPMLQEGGLVPAIRRLVSEIRISGGPDIEFCPDVEFRRLEPPLEYAAFRIIQECLRNAHRHSQSSKVEVRLSRHTSRLRIEVEDFGIGFSPQRVPPGHFGLESVQKRASLLGGCAEVDSVPERGTRVTVELPLVENAPLERVTEKNPVACDSRQLRTRSA